MNWLPRSTDITAKPSAKCFQTKIRDVNKIKKKRTWHSFTLPCAVMHIMPHHSFVGYFMIYGLSFTTLVLTLQNSILVHNSYSKVYFLSPEWNTKQERNATNMTHNIVPGFLKNMTTRPLYTVNHTWKSQNNTNWLSSFISCIGNCRKWVN